MVLSLEKLDAAAKKDRRGGCDWALTSTAPLTISCTMSSGSLCCSMPYSKQAKSACKPSSRLISSLEKVSPGMRPRESSKKLGKWLSFLVFLLSSFWAASGSLGLLVGSFWRAFDFLRPSCFLCARRLPKRAQKESEPASGKPAGRLVQIGCESCSIPTCQD